MWRVSFVVVLLTGPVVGPVAAQSSSSSEEIVLCDLGMNKELAQANASFSLIYELEVGSAGDVAGVREVRNGFLPGKRIAACLSRWRFAGSARKVMVIFNWKHGEGWRSIAIQDGDHTRRIRFNRGWSAAPIYSGPDHLKD